MKIYCVEVMTLGGIQTYISQLTKLALKIGFQVRIFHILFSMLQAFRSLPIFINNPYASDLE